MGRAIDVVTGAYYDHGRGRMERYRLLVPESAAPALTGVLAIVLTLSLPRLVKLILHIKNLSARYWERRDHPWPRDDSRQQNITSQTHGLTRASPSHSAMSQLIPVEQIPKVYRRVDASTAIEEVGWNYALELVEMFLPRNVSLRQNVRSSGPSKGALKKFFRLLFLCSAFLGLYVGFIVAGILTGKLAGDDLALARSPDCDLYWPDASNSEKIFQITQPYEFDVQTESFMYARLYSSNAIHTTRGYDVTDIFAQRSISYHVKHNDTCPFADGLCAQGDNSALTLYTDPVPARAIGVNTGASYEFRQTTTCAPLNMNDTFIVGKHMAEREYSLSYIYGRTGGLEGDNVTFKTFTSGGVFEKTPSYFLAAFVHQKPVDGPIKDLKPLFDPIPALKPIDGSQLTLMFILPGKLFYSEYREDPIFPAQSKKKVLGLPYEIWMNLEAHARPLACIDRTEWRNRKKDPEWRHSGETPPRTWGDLPGDHWLFFFSLQNVNIFSAISKRASSALLAQSRIDGWTSLPLEKEQWKTEVTQMFETALARAQFNARNIARGAFAKYPGYIKRNATGAMCDCTYLFHAPGWKNIRLTWYLIVLVPCGCIVLAAVPINLAGKDEEERLAFGILWFGGEELVSYWMVAGLDEFFKIVHKILGLLAWALCGLRSHLLPAIRHGLNNVRRASRLRGQTSQNGST